MEKPHDWKDELGIGLRSMNEGAALTVDLINKPVRWASNAVTGALGLNPAASASEAMAGINAGLPTAQTDGEKLAAAITRGATGGMLTGGTEAAPALMAALSGGSAGGAGELARQNGAGPMGQLAASLAGGIAAPGAVAAGSRVLDSAASTLSQQRVLSPTMQAFADQQVPALPAAVGGTATRMATAAAKTTLGGVPIHEAAQASITAARAARERIAAGIGNVAGDATAAGSAAQRGANTFLASTKIRGGKLYDAIPIPANRSAVLTNTKQALGDLTSGLSSNPELSQVIADPRMQRIADAIQGRTVQEPTGVLDAAGNPIARQVQKGGALNWQDLKDFRSYIGEKAGAPALQSDTSQANLKTLYGALSDDMKATAQAEGPKALAAFNRANSFWRARQQRIADAITPILGKDGNQTSEQAFRQIQSWASDRGSFVRTAQALRSLPEEEANTVRATIFDQLGNASKSAQDSTGEVFSPSAFLAQWNKIPQRARNVLFPGEAYQKDIKDLLTIADAQKASERFTNTSNTATATNFGKTVSGAGAAVLGLFTHNPVEAIGGYFGANGAQLAVGRLLASPGLPAGSQLSRKSRVQRRS